MALKKITEADMAGKGVQPLPDVPGLPGDQMKAKFEEIVREVVVPAFNGNVDATYSKAETEGRIDAKVVEIGAGDMAMGDYDPVDEQGAHPVKAAGGIAAYVDAHTAPDVMRKAVYDPPEEGQELGPVEREGGIPRYALSKAGYDPDGAVAAAGGIYNFVDSYAGDMKAADYDPERVVLNAGGIEAYVLGGLLIAGAEQAEKWYPVGTNESGEILYKPWYENVLHIAELPNATATIYPNGVSDVDMATATILNPSILRWTNPDYGTMPPYANTSNVASQVGVQVAINGIRVSTGSDRRSMSASIWYGYTKTTDAAMTRAEIGAGAPDGAS